jgi:acetolactate synthase-1/2/3 large subunit
MVLTADTAPAGQPRTAAEAFLVALRRRGVDRLFVNAGTDFAPLVEAYATQKHSGLEMPEILVCAHENLAISMAHGAHLGDGRTPAVMLHTSVGTANAICGVINAARSRVPILLAAGRTPLFEQGAAGARDGFIHWAQEMFDQGGMLRELVAWDYELRDPLHVDDVVDRAIDVARTEQCPVYLTLPREVLAAPAAAAEPPTPPAQPTRANPDPAAVAELARLLATARFPLVVTGDAGADHAAVPLLAELADRFGIPVVELGPRYLSLPADHRMHAGYAPKPLFEDADVVLCLDVDVPWLPTAYAPRPDAVVVQAGPTPNFPRYPMRTHRSDLTITAAIRPLLVELERELSALPVDAERGQRLASVVGVWREQRDQAVARDAAAGGPITKTFLNATLAQAMPRDAVVVSEYWASPAHVAPTEPGSYFGTPQAGGLGWGLPAALGIQLARRDATVVAALGDGAYLFANPAACHHAMAVHDLPVLTVVCSNEHWGAVQGAALRMYPDGNTAATDDLSPLARLDPVPDFTAYARASGGHGERVEERADLLPALQRAFAVVREQRRPALLDVRCAG